MRAVVLCVGLALGGCGSVHREDAVHGIVLGMTPDQVRGRFALECQGHFAAHDGEAGALVLDWRADANSQQGCVPNRAAVPQARFEFHRGMLVAMRLASATRARRQLEVNGALVVDGASSRGMSAGTYRTIIALDCPEHRAEVSALRARPTH